MAESREHRLYGIAKGNVFRIDTYPNAKTIFSSSRARTDILFSEEGDDCLAINGQRYEGSFYLSSSLEDEWILPLLVEGYSPSFWNQPVIDKDYIKDNILPLYDSFDGAHQRDHAEAVIEASLKAAADFGINPDICYLVAAYHDIGLSISRELHHIESARLFRMDKYIKAALSSTIIDTVATAIEDHRASAKILPRSIFGIVVADADRLLDPKTVIKRTIKYGKTHFLLTFEEQKKRCYEHLCKKYSRDGYLKYYLPTDKDINNHEEIYNLIESEKAFSKFFDEIYQEIF